MILKTLTLKNFRKFKQTSVEFPDGVIGVIGLNGVGKSTIFEAIAWALYGSVAARTSSDQIKRQSSDSSDVCRVELDFIFEDNTYRLIREMRGKAQTTTATVTINGKIAATGAETVNHYMQEKLGMDFKSFFTSIFAKQKELNTLSSMNASERRPVILRMLGIDSLDEVIKEVRSDKKNKDNLIDQLDHNLVNEKGEKKENTYNQEIEDLEKNKKEIDNEIKKSKDKIQVFKKDLKALEKIYLDKKKEYEKLNEKKEKLSDKKTLFERKRKLEEEIKELKQKTKDRQKILDNENKKLVDFKNIEKDINLTDKRLDELNNKIEKNVKVIEQKKTLADQIKKDVSEIDKKKKNIEKLGPEAECPTCERVLSDQFNNLINKFEKEKQVKQKEISSFQSEIEKQIKERERLIREQTAIQKKKNYLQNKLRDKERIDTTIKNITTELNSEKIDLEKKQKHFKEIKVTDFNVKEFENIKKQVESFYREYQKSLEAFNNKKDDFSEINIDLEKKEGNKKLISQEIKNFKEKIFELEKFKKQLKQEKQAVFYLNLLSDVMSNFRTYLISRIRPTLSYYSSDFFSRLTDGKYISVELDENYNLMIYDNGEFYSIERFSGGEEDLANLCLRLAISEVITERAGGAFNFIILDEIFGSQDLFRRQNIMKALNNLSSKFRQIFLITHVEDVKNEMEHILSVSENQEGISNIKIE